MKKNIRIFCLLLAGVMLFAVGGFSAFASEAEDLINDLESDGAYISGADVSGTEVSGTEVSGADVSPSDHLADFPLEKVKIPEYGFSMLMPSYDSLFSVGSDPSELEAVYGQAHPSGLFDLSDYYSGTFNYLCAGYSDSQNSIISVTYTENNYSHYIGSYSRLDGETLKSIADVTYLIDEANGCEIRSINGNACFYQEIYSSDDDTATFILQTIVGGGIYEVYIVVMHPDAADYVIVDEIIESVKIKGYDNALSGAADNTAVIWLAVICGILVVAVALLAFFVIRFSMFAKAAGSNFDIIGFNLPPKGLRK